MSDKHNIRLAPNLAQVEKFLPPLKQDETEIINKASLIYSIPCECGLPYIGETGRQLKCRITEHKRAIWLGSNKTGLDRHVNQTSHKIC